MLISLFGDYKLSAKIYIKFYSLEHRLKCASTSCRISTSRKLVSNEDYEDYQLNLWSYLTCI